MLSKEEKRILFGLYLNNPRIDRSTHCTAHQINWLGAHSYRMAMQWRVGDSMREHSIQGMDSVEASLLQAGMAAAALGHLEGAGFLTYAHGGILGEQIEVTVTYKGAGLARALMTWRGRLDLWYRERKDGVLGIALTVGVAALTAWVTTWIRLKTST